MSQIGTCPGTNLSRIPAYYRTFPGKTWEPRSVTFSIENASVVLLTQIYFTVIHVLISFVVLVVGNIFSVVMVWGKVLSIVGVITPLQWLKELLLLLWS